VFREIQAAGGVADDEMAHVFNLGLGMLSVVSFGDRFATLDVLRAAGHESEIVGEIVDGHGTVELVD